MQRYHDLGSSITVPKRNKLERYEDLEFKSSGTQANFSPVGNQDAWDHSNS